MQIGHRLFLQPGKCQNIHGHSMKVHLTLYGQVDENGIFESADFGDIKKVFRMHLDTMYDHHLLLNKADPFAQRLFLPMPGDTELKQLGPEIMLPGLIRCEGDPTTENLAKWIGQWAINEYELDCDVRIDETESNSVAVGAYATR
jgi:6-pyruvoyltetrahydropterin/6-carboxytetrahydropterin synthase